MTDTTHPELRLIDVIGATVPRYTSYPTAPHFNADVDGAVYGGWLGQVARHGEAISLYLHVPFCRAICHYCGCTTRATRQEAPLSTYVDLLRREIAMVADRVGRLAVSHIHWGGGSPNLLPAPLIEAIVADLKARFVVDSSTEHAMELDPRLVNGPFAAALADLGINRVSLGVQDFEPAVQAAIGRIQPLERVEQAVAALRSVGISAINFDLIYGLPEQTRDSIRRTAMAAAGLAPSRISLFGYAHVPWFRANQKLIVEADLPDSEMRLELAQIARTTIDAFGYEEIGIDHYARPEDELAVAARARSMRRNFQGYTTDTADTLIGFGASSISRTPWGYAQNVSDTDAWQSAIGEGRLAIARGRAFSSDDHLRGDVIEQVLCSFSVDLVETATRHGADPAPLVAELGKLDRYVKAGWVRVDGPRVEIVRHRIELARIVAAAFDTYLGHGGRHSIAV
jgi:oxygen-independent coproporphyrinogen III oxidase